MNLYPTISSEGESGSRLLIIKNTSNTNSAVLYDFSEVDELDNFIEALKEKREELLKKQQEENMLKSVPFTEEEYDALASARFYNGNTNKWYEPTCCYMSKLVQGYGNAAGILKTAAGFLLIIDCDTRGDRRNSDKEYLCKTLHEALYKIGVLVGQGKFTEPGLGWKVTDEG